MRTILHVVMSAVVLLAGLYVAFSSTDLRAFGWVLAAIGALSLLAAVFTRRPRA